MHRIYFIFWKKEKARIKFMNFSEKYMGSVFFLGGVNPVCRYIYVCVCVCVCVLTVVFRMFD